MNSALVILRLALVVEETVVVAGVVDCVDEVVPVSVATVDEVGDRGVVEEALEVPEVNPVADVVEVVNSLVLALVSTSVLAVEG